jgi:hypothetical protein
MKITKLLVLAVSVFVAQSSFAARLSVYNESGEDAFVKVYCDKKGVSYEAFIPKKTNGMKESKYVFDSGLYAFSKLRWIYGSSNYIYERLIPSTRVMLGGIIVLRNNAFMDINFDAKGVSSSKMWPTQGRLVFE